MEPKSPKEETGIQFRVYPSNHALKRAVPGTSLTVQWLRPSNAGCADSIPGWGAKSYMHQG